jgi:hypothetical protein
MKLDDIVQLEPLALEALNIAMLEVVECYLKD